MIARPLATTRLATRDPSFVVVEWSDDGQTTRQSPVAPLHLHRNEDEAWIVLEGRLGVQLGEEDAVLTVGDAVLAPRGTPHTYWNAGDGLLRYVLVMGPRTAALIDALHRPRTNDLAVLFNEYDAELLPSGGG